MAEAKTGKHTRVRRERSYRPAWGQAQTVDEYEGIHDRWCAGLMSRLPEGVPEDGDKHGRFGPWPATFGDYDEATDTPTHQPDEGQGYCLQCGGCRYYMPVPGRLGMDWGACSNPRSEYDARMVFEHWTCRVYRR